MSKATDIPTKPAGDVVLREVWRAKDTLSGQYGHNLDKLFEETQKEGETFRPSVGKPSHQAPQGLTSQRISEEKRMAD